MGRALLQTHRLSVSALLIVVAITFSVNCVYAIGGTPKQSAMGDDCPMGQEHPCCRGADSSGGQNSTVTERLTLMAPYQMAAASIDYPEPPRFESQWNRVPDRAVPKPPGVPTYLLVSTFRL
jgi:hypothetical protein